MKLYGCYNDNHKRENRLYRMQENAKAAEIFLTDEEIAFLDATLEMSAVFGGTPVKQ